MTYVKLNPNATWCPHFQDVCQKHKCVFYVETTQQKLTNPEIKWTGNCALLLQCINQFQQIEQDNV